MNLKNKNRMNKKIEKKVYRYERVGIKKIYIIKINKYIK